MMCSTAGGVIFTVPLALSLCPGLEMVPKEEEVTSVSVQFFCYFVGMKLFSGMQIVMVNFEIVMVNFESDGNLTEPDKSIYKSQSCQIACLHY